MEINDGLHAYSIGIVVEDKLREESVIKAFPTEHITDKDIVNLSDVREELYELEDSDKNISAIKIEESNIIRCQWLPLGNTNRTTPPDVVKGERVRMYRFGNTDNYFWVDLMTENHLRKTEHIMYVLSNTPEYKVPLTKDNSYYILFSTKDKKIHLHTSKNDGELTDYDIELDTLKGQLDIRDGRGNYIKLESFDDSVRVKVNNTTYVDAKTLLMGISEYTELKTKLFRVISDKTEINP